MKWYLTSRIPMSYVTFHVKILNKISPISARSVLKFIFARLMNVKRTSLFPKEVDIRQKMIAQKLTFQI